MQGTHGQFHVLVVDDHRSLDLAGADHLDVDALFRQRTEHAAGHANVTAHADTDDGYLADLVVRHDFLGADGGAHLVLQQIQRASEIVAVNREREVRGAFDRLVLQNHVHVDVGRCHRARMEYATPGLSGTASKVNFASSRLKAMPETTACSIFWSSSKVMSVPEDISSSSEIWGS